ncbi:MAG TPA: response regulator transcription factor [Aggregatilineales bacterium]|nr:response regulator transcription factor [Aggregatilineales bacterium]
MPAKILLVEDQSDLAQVIIRELSSAGYELIHASDGLSALQLHASYQPDAVILDWMLPKLDGLSVLEQIRKTAITPILMLTAKDAEADRVAGLKAGADDYLTKPFGMQELEARIEALLRRADLIRKTLEADSDHARTPMQYENLFLDPQAYIATIDGEPINLSRTEFELLHLLVRNPGRAFTRAYLIETVWREDATGSDRAVDSAMQRLRKKLGTLGEMIEARWGIGYRWRKT